MRPGMYLERGVISASAISNRFTPKSAVPRNGETYIPEVWYDAIPD